MNVLFIAIIILMIVATLWWILNPILFPQSLAESHNRTDNEAVQELEVKRDAIYAAVKDLEMDFESGKIAEQDYQQTRLKFFQSVALILKKIDQFSASTEARLDGQIDELLNAAAQQPRRGAEKIDIHTEITSVARNLPTTAESEFRCSECGHSYTPGDAFCAQCGTALRAICPACDAAVTPDDKFCPQCGESLATTEVASS